MPQVSFTQEIPRTEVDPFTTFFLNHRHTPRRHHVAAGNRDTTTLHWVRPTEVSLYPQVVVNPPSWVNFLPFDLDGGQESAVDRVEAFYDLTGISGFYVLSPNGLHLYLAIDPVHLRHHKSAEFMYAVWANLNRLLGGDPGYGRHTARNPEYDRSKLVPMHGWNRIWGLKELRSLIGDAWHGVSFLDSLRRGEGSGLGRNSSLFTDLVAVVRRGETFEKIHLKARALADPTLSESEVRNVATSVYRRRSTTNGHSASAEFLGRRGGKKNSEAQREHRVKALATVNSDRGIKAQERVSEARKLRTQGLSLRKIAQALQCGLATVHRYLRDRILLDLNPANRKPRNTGPTFRVRTLARRLLGVKPIRIPTLTATEVDTS